MTTVNDEGRPKDSVLTDATVIVMNRGLDPDSGQGMLAISPRGCFYFEGGDNACRTISLNELETYINSLSYVDENRQRILDLIKSTIIKCKNGNHPS